MRKADTYRGARRNAARRDRKAARAEKRQGALIEWRTGKFAIAANIKAKINERADMANTAREVAAKAMVAAGVLAQPAVAIAAMHEFYSSIKPPRSRVVNRITRQLKAQMPRARKAA